MKHLLIALAIVGLVGCGKSEEPKKPAAAATASAGTATAKP